MSNTQGKFFKFSALFSAVLLVACGGGSGNNNANEDIKTDSKPTITYSTITGTAFADTALNGATVTAICKDGAKFTTEVKADTQGKWQGQIDSAKFPCRLAVTAGNQTYHSYISKAGSVNINPLTDLVISSSSTQIPSVWYKSGTDLTANTLNNAASALIKILNQKDYTINPQTDILNGELNSEVQQVIQHLIKAIDENTAIQNYDALLTLVKDGNLNQLPQKIKATETPDPTPTAFNLNLNACQPFLTGGVLYNKCSKNVVSDFAESNLVDFHSNEKCSIKKQGDTITFSKGNKSFTVIYDQEEQDGVHLLDTGGFNMNVATGPYEEVNGQSVYRQLIMIIDTVEQGKITQVGATSPTLEANCIHADIKKQLNS